MQNVQGNMTVSGLFWMLANVFIVENMCQLKVSACVFTWNVKIIKNAFDLIGLESVRLLSVSNIQQVSTLRAATNRIKYETIWTIRSKMHLKYWIKVLMTDIYDIIQLLKLILQCVQ